MHNLYLRLKLSCGQFRLWVMRKGRGWDVRERTGCKEGREWMGYGEGKGEGRKERDVMVKE